MFSIRHSVVLPLMLMTAKSTISSAESNSQTPTDTHVFDTSLQRVTNREKSLLFATELAVKYSGRKLMSQRHLRHMLHDLGFTSSQGPSQSADRTTFKYDTAEHLPSSAGRQKCLDIDAILSEFRLKTKKKLKSRDIMYLSSAIVHQLVEGCLSLTNSSVARVDPHRHEHQHEKDTEMELGKQDSCQHDSVKISNPNGHVLGHENMSEEIKNRSSEFNPRYGQEEHDHGHEHEQGHEHDQSANNSLSAQAQHGHASNQGGARATHHDLDHAHETHQDTNHAHETHHDTDHAHETHHNTDHAHETHHDTDHAHETHHDTDHAHETHHDTDHAHETHHDTDHAHETHHDTDHAHETHHDTDHAHGTHHDTDHAHETHHDTDHVHETHHDPHPFASDRELISTSEDTRSNYNNHHHVQGDVAETHLHFSQIPAKVWGFSIVAVIGISLVGLGSVAVIPLMTKVFYHSLINFLIAMAVGALSGDALLHLIPHALSGDVHAHAVQDDHAHHDGSNDDHALSVWKGVASLAAMVCFFIVERILNILLARRRIKHAKVQLTGVKEVLANTSTFTSHCDHVVGIKLSSHDDPDYQECEELMFSDENIKISDRDINSFHNDNEHLPTFDGKDHNNAHSTRNGTDSSSDHAHSHGHTHLINGIPNSVAAIAWMVIVGDGVHNLCDGLALGAAFANSVTDGISTSIAIFCHELPHEIGDFAVLLQAGMSVKLALVYNCVSSILCFIGMVIGVAIGNIGQAAQWIFVCVAGMFIYIALVDMMPELMKDERKVGDGGVCRLILQVTGMALGAGIMAAIALYEHKLMDSIEI